MCKSHKPFLRIALALLFLNFSFIVKAQSDFRSRTGIKLKTEAIKDVDFILNIQQRFNNKLSTFDKFLMEPGIAYDLNKRLKTGVEYRYYYNQNQDHTRESRHRFSWFIRYKKNIEDFALGVKTILQYGIDDDASFAFDYRNKFISRNSISLSYDIFGSKLTPKAEYDIFYHINNPRGGIINGWRITTSFDYDLSKNKTLAFYYMFDKELNVVSPLNAHILGIELEIELF